MSLSKIGRAISESATLKLNKMAAQLRSRGEPLIHLGGGEPKSMPPIDALLAASAMLASGEIRYTPADGVPALKQAVVDYTQHWYGHSPALNEVVISSGAKQSIMIALLALVDPGDEVVYPAPYWVSYPDMVKLCGATPVVARAADGSFVPTIADIERCVTAKTKCLLINSPNNPSGAVYPESLIAEVVGFCEHRGIYLIMDDIYQRLVFDGRKPLSCYAYARQHGDDSRLVVVNGVSKQYAMTGFRIGWATASKAVASAMTNIQSHQTSGASALTQAAALGALSGSQDSVEQLRITLENNRDVLVKRLRTLEGVRIAQPGGTFYAFCDFSHFDRDSARLAALLLEKASVITVPGAEFGCDGHLRLSFCGTTSDIIEGVERIHWALDPHAPRETEIGGRRRVKDWT